MTRYSYTDRPIPGGSCEERFAPKFGDDNKLNRKLGPRHPRPLVRETGSAGCLYETNTAERRRAIGLPSRFDKS